MTGNLIHPLIPSSTCDFHCATTPRWHQPGRVPRAAPAAQLSAASPRRTPQRWPPRRPRRPRHAGHVRGAWGKTQPTKGLLLRYIQIYSKYVVEATPFRADKHSNSVLVRDGECLKIVWEPSNLWVDGLYCSFVVGAWLLGANLGTHHGPSQVGQDLSRSTISSCRSFKTTLDASG